jgi:hypothetical protein
VNPFDGGIGFPVLGVSRGFFWFNGAPGPWHDLAKISHLVLTHPIDVHDFASWLPQFRTATWRRRADIQNHIHLLGFPANHKKQRLDHSTKRPVGPLISLMHFHSSRLSTAHIGYGQLEIGVSADKVLFNLGELTGNIWTITR